MMRSYVETIRFLFGLQTFGMKFGLSGIRALLRHLGNPQDRVACIHVAGTNGKGSTAAMIAAVLTSAGYRTGLYTSPHLVSYEERMRIDGRPIPKSALVRIAGMLKPVIKARRSTFFEATTAIALKWFEERKVEIAVIETGLGGRLDATNVVHPLVSVITTIDLEHTHLLGSTIRSIAREKAGIIKHGIPCITAVRQPEAMGVLENACRRNKALLVHAESVQWRVRASDWSGHRVDGRIGRDEYRNLTIALPGEHQLTNAACALLALRKLHDRGFAVSAKAIADGFARTSRITHLRGRLSIVRRRPLVIADVAHNPAAMNTLTRAFQQMSEEPAVVVFGVMRDKDLRAMANALAPITGHAFAVAARTERSRPSADVTRAFMRAGVPVDDARSVQAGVKKALRHVGRHPVLITGSHFVVGEALAMLGGRNYLTINQ